MNNNDDFVSILKNGQYKDKQFSANNQNLISLISAVNKLQPNQENFLIVFGMMKFYRFPVMFCLSKFFDKLSNEKAQQDKQLKKLLLQIGSFANCLFQQLKMQKFHKLDFLTKFGIAKKKFSMKMCEEQIQFAQIIQLIINLGNQIQNMYKQKLPYKDIKVKINELVTISTDRKSYFQNYAIQVTRRQYNKIIQKIDSDSFNQEHPVRIQKPKQIIRQQSLTIKNEKNNYSQNKFMHKQNQQSQSSKSLKKYQENIHQIQYLCCRTFFYRDQVIQQPQSLQIQYKYYRFPFDDRPDQSPSKRQKIKRTICGFLNAEGGIIYFGIKQDTQTRKRVVAGMYLSENKKKAFTNEIMYISKSVLPNISKNIEIKYVPIKQTSGYYIAKVIVQRGAKDQIYSYEQNITFYDNNFPKQKIIQKFAFKTQNQVLIYNQAQKILKIFKNKLNQPQKKYYPLHEYPCKQPEKSKFCYQQVQSENEQFPSLTKHTYVPKGQFQRQQKKKVFYARKNSNAILFGPMDKQTILKLIKQYKIDLIEFTTIQENPFYHFVQLNSDKQIDKFNHFPGQYQKVYDRISYDRCDQYQTMNDVIEAFKKQCKDGGLTRQRYEDKLLMFSSQLHAVKFYVKIVQLMPKIQFTSRG